MRTGHPVTTALGALGAGLVITAITAAAGCDPGARTGGGPATASTDPKGTAEQPKGEVPTVCTGCVTEERLGQRVRVEAGVVQQCPARGCWLKLKDDAGEVMVDLAPAKLELAEERVGQQAGVTGTVVKKGGKVWLEAETIDFSPAGKKDPAPTDKK